MGKAIKFYSGEENGIVKEEKLDDSIFDKQYRKAVRLLEYIKNHYSPQFSNIIAFCGDRGDGKTSAMLSFVESLDKNSFDVLEAISPSHFDEEHNILELVIGQMYKSVENAEESDTYERLMDCFAAIERCCAVLKPGSDSLYDRIAEIHELSASMNLHVLIERLFKCYLEIKKKVGGKVIIVIDDMDYNWFGAYTMIKMIEKYLHNEHCVLVVSVKIEQLAELVYVGFERELKGGSSTIDLKKIAQKYINKVIPIFNRIEMPKVRDIVDKKLLIYESRKSEADGEKAIEEFNSVKEGVLKLIFQKTRYLFYNSKGNVSLIVPTDLRSLRQLLGLLMGMKYYQKDSEDQNVRDENEENKRLFKYYFFYTWTQQLEGDDRIFADKLVDNNDTYSINKLVVNYMQRYIDDRQRGDYANVLKASNYGYNITIGDVFDMMDMIERNALDIRSRMISFFIRSFYSIRLYEYYDEATEDKKELTTLHPGTKDETENGMPEIYKSDPWYKNTNSLQRFVNGSYFTYKSGKIIEYVVDKGNENYERFPLDSFCLDGKTVQEFFAKLRGMSKNDADFKETYQFAEYLMLGIQTSINKRIDDVRTLEKDFASPLYLKPFTGNEDNYVFDITAPFANMVNIKYTYERFEKMLDLRYDYSATKDWTVLGKMKQRIPPLEGNHPESKVASDAIIRNAEVLGAVRERVLSNHILIENKANCLSSYADFYSSLIDSDMRTYPQTKEQKDIYTIQFEFLRVLSDVLMEIGCAEFNDVLIKYIDIIMDKDSSDIEKNIDGY